VVTIHDLIPLVVPGYHRSRQSALYSAFMGRLARRAAAIVTVSEYSKRDIERTLGIPESRIYVTREGADERFRPQMEPAERERLRARYGLPDRFVLYIGGSERRKGIEMLVRAWSHIAGTMRDREVKLVIVADFPPPDRLYPDIPGLIEHLGLHRDVLRVRYVDETDKPALYRAALALAFPSTYEGFGLTPLEAMASGLPVVASDATSIPEVVGDAGVLLPPDHVDAWASALLTLVDSEDERRRLSEDGLRRAASFSWRRTAEETVRVYREVLGS
jgi:glycosyltransferase involved in cell wall biosynthesis